MGSIPRIRMASGQTPIIMSLAAGIHTLPNRIGSPSQRGPFCEKGAYPWYPIMVISHVEDLQLLWGGCLALAPPRLSDDLIRLLNPVVSWRREKIG